MDDKKAVGGPTMGFLPLIQPVDSSTAHFRSKAGLLSGKKEEKPSVGFTLDQESARFGSKCVERDGNGLDGRLNRSAFG